MWTKASYRRYLKTPHWTKVKRRIYKQRKGKCERCGKLYSLQVHHKTYKNIGHEKDRDLLLWCKKCHRKHHKRASWKTLGLWFLKH